MNFNGKYDFSFVRNSDELTCNEEFFPASQERPVELCTNICPADRVIYPHARLAAQAKLNPLVRFAMCNLHEIATRVWEKS